MAIKKLPEYMINRLKAGEIVDRPASVIKELVENSLDAGATKIVITINDGGKSLISVEDNGSGIELSDMDLLLERYATSKIFNEHDLDHLRSYGFRGEALASISEVSKTSVISKTAYAEIGTKLSKLDSTIVMKHLPVGFPHGTIIQIQDLFYNVPARLKFLKSAQTEYFYAYNYFIEVALFHHDKHRILKKNDKIVFDLAPTDGVLARVGDLFKKDRCDQLKPVQKEEHQISLTGLLSDGGLTFGSPENIKIFVNKRPVQDKVVKKALLDAYVRQITPGEYPFALLMIDVDPSFVDVNVHPRKLEVKFIDPNRMFQFVQEAVKEALGIHKIITVPEHHRDAMSQAQQAFAQGSSGTSSSQTISSSPASSALFDAQDFSSSAHTAQVSSSNAGFFAQETQQEEYHQSLGTFQIVGQVRKTYIVMQTESALMYVDQHALAERIAFEHMKKVAQDAHQGQKQESLLQPIMIDLALRPDYEEKLEQLNALGFDCAMITENKMVIYAVPQILTTYKVDIQHLFTHIFALENLSLDIVVDKIFASKACKTSIKAGDILSFEQMRHLIKEGLEHIEGAFVCQHGRPFFISIPRQHVEKLFDR